MIMQLSDMMFHLIVKHMEEHLTLMPQEWWSTIWWNGKQVFQVLKTAEYIFIKQL